MQIKKHLYQRTRKSKHHIPTILISSLTLCLILLSACGNNANNTTSNPSATIPTPTIDPTTKNQGDTQLLAFQQWITLMQQYNGNISIYQQQLNTDQQALNNAKTESNYKSALSKLNAHVDAIKIPAMKTEIKSLLNQLQQGQTSWGQQHQYHDDFNNTTYQLGFEYGPNGIEGWAQQEFDSAQTLADYQQTIEDVNMYLTNFQAMTTNAEDTTPYNQVHQTDLQLLQHYGYMNKKVVVVSLYEQAMRVYQNGKLVKAFLVTTGRPERPSPPGTWWVEGKQSPTVFKASVPKSSPYWYPDTPINFAMQYHSDGYFLHDSWWRSDYGPGTNFPHQDSSGDSFSSFGSHGCVNIQESNASWLYNFVSLYTPVLVY
ncbi:MAG: L,D-transpeptidase [Ktedonobacteraceae bacterium]